jgi:hypothetical protein
VFQFFWYIVGKEQKKMIKKGLQGQSQSLFQWARSCFQRTEPTHQHHLAQLTAKKWLTPLFGFGLTLAPKKTYGFDKKSYVVGKYRGKAATIYNERFGTMAGVPRWIALQNSKLRGSWQV